MFHAVSPRLISLAVILVSALALMLLANSAAAATDVDPDSFQARLAAAGQGDVLRLAPGEYGHLAGRGLGGAPGAPLVLRAANPADPPRFSGLDLREPRHLVLDGLLFDYRADPEHAAWFRPFQITGGTDLRLIRLVFDGDVARGRSVIEDGFATGFGLALTDVDGVTLEDSEIRGFLRGLVVARSRDVTIRRNELYDLRSDGMNFAQVQRVVIADNVMRDFRRAPGSGDHLDMIQFWTNGTEEPSGEIVIRRNTLLAAPGEWTQSIFMRNDMVDRGLAGEEMFYRNVLIEENFIHNAHTHGITVGETRGLVIRRNTVVRNPAAAGPDPGRAVWIPTIRVSPRSERVVIEANAVAHISGPDGQPDWYVARNLLVQDRTRTEPHHYSRVFAGLDATDPASFAPRPGGPLDGTGIGARQ